MPQKKYPLASNYMHINTLKVCILPVPCCLFFHIKDKQRRDLVYIRRFSSIPAQHCSIKRMQCVKTQIVKVCWTLCHCLLANRERFSRLLEMRFFLFPPPLYRLLHRRAENSCLKFAFVFRQTGFFICML